MKIVIQIILSFLLILSCNKKTTESAKNPKPILIKIGYYPSFHTVAETILNLTDKYVIFYSPTSYHPAPPPPSGTNMKMTTEEKKDYQKYLKETPKLKYFKNNLNTAEIKDLEKISIGFNSEDFSERNMIPPYDGMSINIIILYSDGKLVQINPDNAPTEKQREYYSKILDLLILKNTDENNSIILQKIKNYD